MSDGLAGAPRPTDRGAWRLVAARDFTVRLRDKGFVISTAITLTVLSVFILLRAFGGSDEAPVYRVGLVGTAGSLQQPLERSASGRGAELEVTTFDDDAMAEAALARGDVEVVLDDETTIVGNTDVSAPIRQIVQDAVEHERIRAGLADAGVEPGEIDALLDRPSIGVRTLEPQDPDRDENAGIAFIAVLLAYGQLFGYGVWVATGVIEEKASRVVEILLSTIRPRELLAGKVIGLGLLGLGQLLLVAAVGVLVATATGVVDVDADLLIAVGLSLMWFVLGYAFFACAFACAGALVPRLEELQASTMPLTLTIMVSLFVAFAVNSDPDGTLAHVTAFIPFTAPMTLPPRILVGAAPWYEVVGGALVTIAAAAALIPLAARIYSGAVLRTGSAIKLRDAWRASAPSASARG